ncbi:MAG: hypothetical protein A2X36_06665 [Elusimicrobia bacterium GWA2_69_24]|nr:MAG: hypothetical protein A2X36_06665 [Elusimicrobia bacterium GWA2_69_24]HBL18664.1 hypothetical protein [Elusimicrobiota bacterium]
MIPPYSIVFVTAPDRKAADTIADGLINAHLAACVNIVPGLSSVYWWEKKVQRSEEILLIIKTRTALLAELGDFVKKNHPSSVPEVISVHIQDGFKGYLDFIGANTLFTKRSREGPRA